MLKNLLRLCNTIFPFADFLYILQLEEYDNVRFTHTMVRFWFKRNIQKRDTLKFTSRIQTILMLSVGIILLTAITLYFMHIPVLIICIPLSIPIFILISNVLLTPFYEHMKYRLQRKAQALVKRHSRMTVVAIAGSYGKTTTKNFLYELLKYNYKIQMVPGNINTPTGIAAWILKNLQLNTDVLLVEMDTYFLGEIKRSCMIVEPHISAVTSIGDQHLERFKTQQKMALAILEVFTCARSNAKRFTFDEAFKTLKKLKVKIPKNIERIKTHKLPYKTNIVSKTGKKDLLMAYTIAQEFEVPTEILKDTFLHLSHPDRRQKLTHIQGYKAIDDSYNISFTTALAAVDELKALGRKHQKKTVVVTAGIPELGPENIDSNKKYGLYLRKNVDHVVVLNSIYKNDLWNHEYTLSEDMSEAWEIIRQRFPPKTSILLIQPELTDLYYSA